MYPFISEHLGLTFTEGTQAPVTEDSTDALVVPGSIAVCRLYDRGAAFVYVKAGATLADGNVVALGLSYVDADVDAAQTTSEYVMTGTGDFTADELCGLGSMVVINAGGGLKFGSHFIKKNTANVLTTDRVWGEALTTSSDYIVHTLNRVVKADIDAVGTKHVAGVAIGAITSGKYGWIQISGVHWKVLSVGNTDAAVIGEGMIANTAVGLASGWTNAATSAENVFYSFGMALCSDAEAAGTGEGVPVLITDCAKFWV